MIHFTSEGHCMKLGLNLRRATGGFVAYWMWYDFATYTATSYRFRLRVHMRPWLLRSVSSWNVIDDCCVNMCIFCQSILAQEFNLFSCILSLYTRLVSRCNFWIYYS